MARLRLTTAGLIAARLIAAVSGLSSQEETVSWIAGAEVCAD